MMFDIGIINLRGTHFFRVISKLNIVSIEYFRDVHYCFWVNNLILIINLILLHIMKFNGNAQCSKWCLISHTLSMQTTVIFWVEDFVGSVYLRKFNAYKIFLPQIAVVPKGRLC